MFSMPLLESIMPGSHTIILSRLSMFSPDITATIITGLIIIDLTITEIVITAGIIAKEDVTTDIAAGNKYSANQKKEQP